LSRGVRSSPANASRCDTHRDPITTYPLQVVRTLMQTQRHGGGGGGGGGDAVPQRQQYPRSFVGCVRFICKEEGLRGFYGGLGPNILRVMPHTLVVFCTYEW
jgi:hypothetical protein